MNCSKLVDLVSNCGLFSFGKGKGWDFFHLMLL